MTHFINHWGSTPSTDSLLESERLIRSPRPILADLAGSLQKMQQDIFSLTASETFMTHFVEDPAADNRCRHFTLMALRHTDQIFARSGTQEIRQYREDQKVYADIWRASKVLHREIASLTDIFNQPQWVNPAPIFQRSTESRRLIKGDVALESFPTLEMINNITNGDTASYVFSICDKNLSFGIEGGHLQITTNLASLAPIISATKRINNPVSRLQTFIENAHSKQFGISSVFTEPNASAREMCQRDFAENLLLAGGPFYIKPACGSCAFMVSRMEETADNSFCFSSNDESFAEFSRQSCLAHNLEPFPAACEINDSHPLQRDYSVTLSRENAARFITLLLRECHPAIIESEIPGSGVGTENSEIRLICQAINGKWTVPGIYARTSANTVSVNISVGGKAASAHSVLEKLITSSDRQFSSKKASLKASDIFSELVEHCCVFLASYEKDFTERIGDFGPRDLSIDLRPVWVTEKRCIEFWLMEIQHDYGMTGLEEVDPEAATLVRAQRGLTAKR